MTFADRLLWFGIIAGIAGSMLALVARLLLLKHAYYHLGRYILPANMILSWFWLVVGSIAILIAFFLFISQVQKA
jgi:hypothetical protein